MLNIPGHKRNGNQNQYKDSTSLLLEWLSSITQMITCFGEDVNGEKGTLIHCW
jgi:hypothetical protein